VPVLGYQTDELPGFYSRSTGLPVDCRLDSPQAIADLMRAKWDFDLDGGLLITNPVPQAHAMPAERIDQAIAQALQEMAQQGVGGKQATPFLLARVAELTGGDSLATNIKLVENNARLAAQIAVAFSQGR
jgi:pseudouridine-5'-phosphate glycosidase